MGVGIEGSTPRFPARSRYARPQRCRVATTGEATALQPGDLPSVEDRKILAAKIVPAWKP
jgi:hypothetical protein